MTTTTDWTPSSTSLDMPLRWRKPRMVRVSPKSDLFHEDVPFHFIDDVFGVMLRATQHTFQVLTKRPGRMLEWADSTNARHDDILGGWDGRNPIPNVWLGVSCEDQRAADERIPLLLDTPAAVRFLSCEPLLGPVDVSSYVSKRTLRHLQASVSGMLRNQLFDDIVDGDGRPLSRLDAQLHLEILLAAGVKVISASPGCDGFSYQTGCPGHRQPSIDWVIVGGESGPGARPCDVAWIRSIVQQCKAAGVACFVKQLGSNPMMRADSLAGRYAGDHPECEWPQGTLFGTNHGDFGTVYHSRRAFLRSRKGADPTEWPEDLRVREFPRAAT